MQCPVSIQGTSILFTDRALSAIEKDIDLVEKATDGIIAFNAFNECNDVVGNLIIAKDHHGDRVYEFKWLSILSTLNGMAKVNIMKQLMQFGEDYVSKDARLFVLYTFSIN